MTKTKTKTTTLSYFLGRTFFLGFGFSVLFKLLNKDTWIVAILGSILGFLLLLFFERFKEKHPINSVVKKGLFFLYNFFIFSQILFIFETFCSSFYLIKSPIFYIILPIPFVIYKITKNGFSTIAKVAEVLLPISLFIYCLVIVYSCSFMFRHTQKTSWINPLSQRIRDTPNLVYFIQ